MGERRVEQVHFYGPDKQLMLALLPESAPGGARTVRVTVPQDPMLLDHLAQVLGAAGTLWQTRSVNP